MSEMQHYLYPGTISGDFGFGGTASNICGTSVAPEQAVFRNSLQANDSRYADGCTYHKRQCFKFSTNCTSNGTGSFKLYLFPIFLLRLLPKRLLCVFPVYVLCLLPKRLHVRYTIMFHQPATMRNTGKSTIAAFATIQKCATVVVAGDTCDVLSGTYNLTSQISTGHSGSSGSPITYKSDTKMGSAHCRPGLVFSTNIWYNTGNYVNIDGFDITVIPTNTVGVNDQDGMAAIIGSPIIGCTTTFGRPVVRARRSRLHTTST